MAMASVFVFVKWEVENGGINCGITYLVTDLTVFGLMQLL